MERNPSLDWSDLFIFKYEKDKSSEFLYRGIRLIIPTTITMNFPCDLNAFMSVILLMVFFKKINKIIKRPHKKKNVQTLFKNVQVK